ncbi:hypothetical protein FNH09_01445 [Streptomyces adustus]|uniref:Uncharacterized protein n=1 Tax=Streptomyces adustus TaxID=1609272 RepID=A0A5N8V4L4_9ACTN|nr:hypothetical protein [Streptomyces adustus]MPY30039.1 hypothetical protein [Streptomyces adustus]
MYEFLMHLLRDSLPEFVGSLLSTTVLATAGWSAKQIWSRRQPRQNSVGASPPADNDSSDREPAT